MSISPTPGEQPTVRHRWHLPPALVLFCLPAIIAEALAGATPPARFFLNPFVLGYLTLYYGSAALLVRELTVRWNKGWPTLLLLGGVWAIVQEGLGTKVFFDPTRTELSPLVNYGTWSGVHWAFVVQLLIYHASFSIVVPLLLTGVAYWPERSARWAPAPVLLLCAICQVGLTAVAYQNISAYKPPAALYIPTVLITFTLIVVARWLPGHWSTAPLVGADCRQVPRPRWFFVLGACACVAFIFVSLLLPGIINAPLLVILLMLVICVGTLSLLRHATLHGRAWNCEHQFALGAGVLAPLIVFSPLQEVRGVTGASVLGVVATIVLWWQWRRVRRSSDQPRHETH